MEKVRFEKGNEGHRIESFNKHSLDDVAHEMWAVSGDIAGLGDIESTEVRLLGTVSERRDFP